MLTALFLAQLVVFSEPGDPLRDLASEIAREEKAPFVSSWAEVKGPYLIWVAAPEWLSDRKVIAFAEAWRDRFPETAVGIITGRSVDTARNLYRRRAEVHAGRATAFVARRGIDPELFARALTSDSYVSFAGHGGQGYLRFAEDRRFESTDVPALRNAVIGTASCNALRPWAQDSIALEFVEHGAAAFAGSVFSPTGVEGIAGGLDGLPYLYTHPEFPVGRVVQLQSHGTMGSYASLPYYLMLGDPRVALQPSAPYRVAEDRETEAVRVLRLPIAPRGFVPVRIAGGAAWSRVEVGGAGAAVAYPFQNERLLAHDSGPDKYVLVEHGGGPLTITLHRDTPTWWTAKTYLRDALDTFAPGVSATQESVLLATVGAVVLWARRRRTVLVLRRAVAAALIISAAYAAWCVYRGTFRVPFIAAVLILSLAGTVVHLGSARFRARAAGLALATTHVWLPALFWLGALTFYNYGVFVPRVGAAVYGYQIPLLGAGALVVAGTAWMAVMLPLHSIEWKKR